MSHLGRVTISLDELEAIRLADLEGDEHEAAAAKMNVSRPTFSRILGSARRSVAEAILRGKALHIAGGPVVTARRGTVSCHRCKRAWEVPVPEADHFRCPRCLSGKGSA